MYLELTFLFVSLRYLLLYDVLEKAFTLIIFGFYLY